MLDEQDLNLLCGELMEKLWGEKLEIPIKISTRMKNSFGIFYSYTKRVNGATIRYSDRIAISKRLLDYYRLDNIEGVLKHELCHYYLFKTGRKYCDGNEEFENELKRIGSQSTRTMYPKGEFHTYKCSHCGKKVKETKTLKKVDKVTKTGVSKCCKANIVYSGIVVRKDKLNRNYKVDNNISIIEEYVKNKKKLLNEKELNNVIEEKEIIENVIEEKEIDSTPKSKLSINEVVILGPNGGVSAQVYFALIKAIKENNEYEIQLIKEHYPKQFNYEFNKFSKKRKDIVTNALQKVIS